MKDNTGISISFTKETMTISHDTGHKTILSKQEVQNSLDGINWLILKLNKQVTEHSVWLEEMQNAKE